MKNLADIEVVQGLLGRHGFRFSKALGQNFLVDGSVCPRMADECFSQKKSQNFGVLEIGPGVGVLTAELSRVARKVVAVELDKRLLPVLAETLADCPNVKIVQGDILKMNLHALLEGEFAGMEVAVCANLPYYITSPVVMRLLEERLPVAAITVMVQKEAADRLCAAPGTRACGAVSAAVRWHAEPEVLFAVGRQSFVPAPKVDSAVIRLNVREAPPVAVSDEAAFFRVVKAAFCQRRKTAANALSAGLSIPKAQAAAALAAAGCKPTARAEELTMELFAALTDALEGVD